MDNEYLQKYERLIELASVLGNQNDFNELLRIVSAHALSLFHADAASIVMINPRTDNTIKTIIRDGTDSEKKQHHFVQVNVIGWVNKNNQNFITNCLKEDSRFRKNLFADSSIQSMMCVPIASEGTLVGYVLIMNEQADKFFKQEDLNFLNQFSAIAAPFLSNIQRIAEFFETSLPDSVLLAKYEALGLLGKSRKFNELLKAIESAVRCDVRVLLEGESGTGKELIARAIHKLSRRKDEPFIAVDCGAIPEQLIESEFFGHVKGAFTGASQDRKGLFEEASGGTLFMDEISNLPYDMQSKLLRVVQENEIRIVGSSQVRKVDVRIIAASSPRLRDLVDDHKFREDLFYRLHVYPIRVPSLNERNEDIPLLANHFLKKFAKEQNKKLEDMDLSLIKYLQNRCWQGNIRELEHFIERLVTLSSEKTRTVDIKILPKEYSEEYKKVSRNEINKEPILPLQKSIEKFEKELIIKTLSDNNWNQSKAARVLKISERSIRYRMEKLGIKNSKP
ncbi:MAG: sigma 54-interacting transcriptional regulator [Methanococcaceae archaeon]